MRERRRHGPLRPRRSRSQRPARRWPAAAGGLLRAAVCLLALTGCGDGRRNLLLVSVDTLRSDHLGAYGGPAGTTPRLDALARESLVFENAFAPAPFTRASVAAMLTGRYPEDVGVVSNGHRLQKGVQTLAAGLWGQGYRTVAVVSNPVLRRNSGLHHGFEVYDVRLEEREKVRAQAERTARPTTDAALSELGRLAADRDRPFFLWVHYQDPHGPYTPPAPLLEQARAAVAPRPGDPPRLPVGHGHRGIGEIPRYQYLEGHHEPGYYRAAYAAEVRHADTEIGRLLSAVSERGLVESTVVIVTADHGESLGEDGNWFAHGEHLSDPQVQVPLLIRAPGLPPGRRSDVASLLDLLPTLFARLGVPPPADLPGRDLLAEDAPRGSSTVHLATLGSMVPRRGLIADGWKLVVERGDETREDLRPVDAGAARPLTAEQEERMRSQLLARWQEAGDGVRPAPVLSDEERRVLMALGYLSEEAEAPPAGPAADAPGPPAAP